MTPLLAEIGDKMPTVVEMWMLKTMLALPLVGLALTHRWVAVAAMTGAAALSLGLAYVTHGQAYLEGSFSEAIWSELGGAWVTWSFVTDALPAVLTGAAAVACWRRAARSRNLAQEDRREPFASGDAWRHPHET